MLAIIYHKHSIHKKHSICGLYMYSDIWQLSGKESVCSAGDARDLGLIPGLGRSPGEGNGHPLSILAWEIPWTKEPGGLHSIGLQKSQTLLSN